MPLASRSSPSSAAIQLAIETVSEQTALGHLEGWILDQGGVDQGTQLRQLVAALHDRLERPLGSAGEPLLEGRHQRRAARQGDQVAGVGAPGGEAGGQPFEVVQLVERLAHFAPQNRVAGERLDRLEAGRDQRNVEQRVAQPGLEQPSPGRAAALVEGLEQGAAAGHAWLEHLQGAQRDLVELHEGAGVVAYEGRDLRQRPALRFAGVGQHRARGPRERLAVEPCGEGAELRLEDLAGAVWVERALAEHGGETAGKALLHGLVGAQLGGEQHLGRAIALQLVEEAALGVQPSPPALAGAYVQQRQAVAVTGGDRCQVGGVGLEQRFVGDGAGGDELGHFAPHQPLRLGRILDLIGHRHPHPQLQQPFDMTVGAAHREAGHGGDEIFSRLAGQHQPQEPRQPLGILTETLVEIPHLKEQQVVGNLLDKLDVLAEQWRQWARAFALERHKSFMIPRGG